MIFCIRKAAVLSGVLLTCSSETRHTILSMGLNSGELDSKMSFSEDSSRLSHHQPWILVFFGLKHSTFGLIGLLVNFPGRLKIIRETCGSNVCIQVLIILKNSALLYAVRFQFFLCGPSSAKSTGNDGSGLLLLLLGCYDEAIRCWCIHISR
jgi:hypothetical protein